MRSSKLSADLTEKMHPVAQITAQAYIAFRALAKEGLIDSDESKALLSSVNLTSVNISLLKKSDIVHIKLFFN